MAIKRLLGRRIISALKKDSFKGWENRAPGAQNPDLTPILRSSEYFQYVLLLGSDKVYGAKDKFPRSSLHSFKK